MAVPLGDPNVVTYHLTITLEVTPPHRADGRIDGQLLVVGSDSVSVSVRVRKETL